MENLVLNRSDITLKEPEHKAKKEVAKYGDQHIGVSVVDARKRLEDGSYEGRTILWPQSFEARLDDFEMQR